MVEFSGSVAGIVFGDTRVIFGNYKSSLSSVYQKWKLGACYSILHWKRPLCWEGLGAGGEGDDRGWDGWMASLTWWTWVWVNSGSWWWTGRPGVLWFMGSQSRTGLGYWTELILFCICCAQGLAMFRTPEAFNLSFYLYNLWFHVFDT